jgi:hypothetical protein
VGDEKVTEDKSDQEDASDPEEVPDELIAPLGDGNQIPVRPSCYQRHADSTLRQFNPMQPQLPHCSALYDRSA